MFPDRRVDEQVAAYPPWGVLLSDKKKKGTNSLYTQESSPNMTLGERNQTRESCVVRCCGHTTLEAAQ